MKRILLTCILGAISLVAASQPELQELRKLLEGKRVTLDYSFVVDGKVHYNGTATIQAPCFKAKGNGLEIYCDGTSRWTVDRESKEVYIETAEGPESYLSYLDGVTDLKAMNPVKEAISDDITPFIFDTSALDSSWVITDLRQ